MRVFYKSVIAVLIHCICFTSIASIRLPGKGTTIKNTVVNYFQCWNQRDMTSAIACFSPDCEYEDTLYPKVFKGKEELQQHLFNVAASLPKSFQFVIDDISEDTRNGKVGIQWHVESNNATLPFTRGSSMYTLDPKTNLITKGFDVPEPTLKSGSFSLALLSLATKFISEPIRVIPFAAWIAYCYFLFFSTDTPGLNALALDPATWQEVKHLSLNYWLILPTLSINTAPTVHPILEGTFNLLLAWVTLFVGFAVDGRSSYGNKNKFTGPLLGMQLLTNAIYLPYLVTRESLSTKYETTGSFSPSFSSLNMIEKIGESKITPIVLSAVGIYAMYWGATARADIYLDLPTRLSSFLKLFQTDRLTFSFVVDLFCLAIFQGWLVDDDAALRKGTSLNESVNEFNMLAAKYVPFFGLAYYLISRPSLPRSK